MGCSGEGRHLSESRTCRDIGIVFLPFLTPFEDTIVPRMGYGVLTHSGVCF